MTRYRMTQDQQFQNNILVGNVMISCAKFHAVRKLLSQDIGSPACGPLLSSRVSTSLCSQRCRQEQFITVLGASWCSHSTWEQHTVVFLIGKNLFKTSCSNRSPYFNRSVLDPGQVPEIKGVTRLANLLRYNNNRLLILLV